MKKFLLSLIAIVSISVFVGCDEDSNPTGSNGNENNDSNEYAYVTRLRFVNETGKSWKSFITSGEQAVQDDFDYSLKIGDISLKVYYSLESGDTTVYRKGSSDISTSTASEVYSYTSYDENSYTGFSKKYESQTIDLPITVNCEIGKAYTLVFRSYDDMELIED